GGRGRVLTGKHQGPSHARIQTKLDLYTQEDSDETRAAQGEFLTAVGMNATVQELMWVVGGSFRNQSFLSGLE
ncbi:MAG: hypothetical protein ACM37Z_10380, partial [Deltaproteobacteria bacterium]